MSEIPPHSRAIIFDCDGTLTDSMPVHYRAWCKTFSDHGVPFSEQQFYAMAGMPTDRIIADVGAQHGQQFDVASLAHEKEQNFLLFLDLVQPVDKVVALARAQKNVRKLAVASGGVRHVIDQQLARLGFTDWFDAIVTAEDTERHKPHPDVFLEAARRMDVEPTDCVVLEDADLGIEAARRAGMPVIDVRRDGWGSSSA